MDVKILKEITSPLSLLYIEDDKYLRAETSKLFGHLFNKVDIAENGKIGLEMFLKGNYDLIVTDINMPAMNGVELCHNIRQHNSSITIIITSAHDESSYLLELIDIGIDKFILKPLDMQKLISVLLTTCSNIMNTKLVLKYKEEIETNNLKLKQKNSELETLVKILDTKIEQQSCTKNSPQALVSIPKDTINTISTTSPNQNNIETYKNSSSDLYLYKEYILANDLHTLTTLMTLMSEHVKQISEHRANDEALILSFSSALTQYAEILSSYSIFTVLGDKIFHFSNVCYEEAIHFKSCCDKLTILLKSFLYVLGKWQEALFVQGVKNPYIYDDALNSDMDTISLILKPQDEDEIDNLKEFF